MVQLAKADVHLSLKLETCTCTQFTCTSDPTTSQLQLQQVGGGGELGPKSVDGYQHFHKFHLRAVCSTVALTELDHSCGCSTEEEDGQNRWVTHRAHLVGHSHFLISAQTLKSRLRDHNHEHRQLQQLGTKTQFSQRQATAPKKSQSSSLGLGS